MTLKFLLPFIFFAVMQSLTGQSCFTNGLTFTAQSQIDQFPTMNVGCKKIEGNLTILGPTIKNLDGLSQITEVKGDIYITGCDSLVSMSGLKNITIIGGAVRIQNNPQLAVLGFDNLKRVKGDFFYISSNPKIKNLNKMNRLDSIFGIFQIWNQDSIATLTGLDSLRFVGKDFSIFKNKNIKNMTGLGSLVHIGDGLRIYENSVLTSVSAISGDLKIDGPLVINDNPALSDCSARAFCEYLKNPPSFVVFNNNKTGCNSVSEVESSCISGSENIVNITAIKIFPNPTSDFIQVEGIESHQSPILIHDMNGQLLMTMNLKYTTHISVAHLPEGMYIVRNGTFHKKLYIQR